METPDPPMLRTSERRSFGRCPQRWEWEYLQGLVPRHPAKALWFGIGIHLALAEWYQPGKKRSNEFIEVWRTYCDEDELSTVLRDTDSNGEAYWVSARELGEEMLKGYYNRYKRDKSWYVIATEQAFQIGIPSLHNPDLDQVIFASTFDGVYFDEKAREFRLMEHKTAKQISTRHLSLDNQGGSYWAVASIILRDQGVLGKKDRISGIEYNFLRKAMPDGRTRDAQGYALNKNGSRSKVQPGPLFHREPVTRTPREQAQQIRKIAAEAEVMSAFREGKLPIYKVSDDSCSWQCPFFAMCELHELGGNDWKEYRDAVYTRRDPYLEHRKSAEAT
jgi:hypothetical protein